MSHRSVQASSWVDGRTIHPTGPELPGRTITEQDWRDVTFLHWRIPAERIAPHLPQGTRPDIHDGSAWIGLIAFRMVGLGVGPSHGLPWLGTFLETNVRTYTVDSHGRRGVTFLTLECDRLVAVLGARALLGLNYRWASQSLSRDQVGEKQSLTYTSRGRPRLGGGEDPSRRTGIRVLIDAEQKAPSETDLFLTARFGLHETTWNRPIWVPNTHSAWPLQQGHLIELRDELVAWCGLPGITDHAPDSVLYSSGVRTHFGTPEFL